MADRYSDADYICHVDSDCIFHRPTTPEDLFLDGKPRIVMTPYEHVPRGGSWQRITSAFLGQDVRFDFMQQLPLLFPRSLYADLRLHTETLHGTDVESYVMAQPPRGFSEFNAMGAFAYAHRREAFTWVDSSRQAVPEAPCLCFWSWGGIDAATRSVITRIVGTTAGLAEGDRAG